MFAMARAMQCGEWWCAVENHKPLPKNGGRPSVRREDANDSSPCNGKKKICGIL
jgi:hypothetical protein